MNFITNKKRKIRTTNKKMPIREFYDKRNKVLIVRDTGGLGDILMLRMIVEDFKLIMPESKIVVATLPNYFQALEDHPFIDEIVNSKSIDENEYIVSYNVTSACIRYETKIAPFSDLHRSEIWSRHCGVIPTKHNMHLSVSEENKNYINDFIKKTFDCTKPLVAFCPMSAMKSKCLNEIQIKETVKQIKNNNFEIFILHDKPIENLNCKVLFNLPVKVWLALLNACDYIITVDTASFHAANGLNKPTLAIFAWSDGKVYGKFHDKMVLVQRHRDNGNWSCGPCYNWTLCTKCSKEEERKPCITTITPKEICEGFLKLVKNFNHGLYSPTFFNNIKQESNW